jgi:hypothetical protein
MADTLSDTRMAAFVALGYTTGSLADRSIALLTAKGAPVGSLADMQIFLGKTPDPDGHVDPTLYP